MSLFPRSFVYESVVQIYVLQYYSLASITLLYYDHILTFRMEVKRIWRRRLTLSGVLFLLNRYIVFFGYFFVIYLSFFAPDNVTFCRKFIRVGGYLNLVSQIIISVLLSLRTYALYNRSRKILFLVSILGVLTVVASAWTINEFLGILTSFGMDRRSVFRTCLPARLVHENLLRATLILSTLFDSVVFLLTVIRTFQIVRQNKNSSSGRGLPNLLMRDGSIYFAVMVVTNLTHLIIFTMDIPITLFARSTGNNGILSHVISVTMTSRLILNLHGFAQKKGKAGNQPRPLPPQAQRTVNTNGTHRRDSEFSNRGGSTMQNAVQLTTEISLYSSYSSWLGRAIDELGVDTTAGFDEGHDDSFESEPYREVNGETSERSFDPLSSCSACPHSNDSGSAQSDGGNKNAPVSEYTDDTTKMKQPSDGHGLWWAQ